MKKSTTKKYSKVSCFSMRQKNYRKVKSLLFFESSLRCSRPTHSSKPFVYTEGLGYFESRGLQFCSTCTKPNSPSNFKWATKPETAQSSSPRSAVTQTYTWIKSSRALCLVSFVLLFRDVSVRLFGGERASLILIKESAKFASPDLPFVGLCGNA